MRISDWSSDVCSSDLKRKGCNMQNATTKEQAQTATNPVAYLVEHGHTHERLSFYPLTGSEKADGWIETPLYAATAPRAIEAAEGDLLGQALGALELWFQYDDGELDNGIDLMASYAAALDATKAVLQKAGRVS